MAYPMFLNLSSFNGSYFETSLYDYVPCDTFSFTYGTGCWLVKWFQYKNLYNLDFKSLRGCSIIVSTLFKLVC